MLEDFRRFLAETDGFIMVGGKQSSCVEINAGLYSTITVINPTGTGVKRVPYRAQLTK